MKKIILHLCAKVGSDSKFYNESDDYEVIKVGIDIGVENFIPPENVYGIIANPVCKEFSKVKGFHKKGNYEKGMFLVNHCLRVIDLCKDTLKFWVIENPASGDLKNFLGKPLAKYQPWEFGSPWSKNTALWGDFNMPKAIFKNPLEVESILLDHFRENKIDSLWKRSDRKDKIASLAYLHKSRAKDIPEMIWAKDLIENDTDFRSMCSQGFAREFFKINR